MLYPSIDSFIEGKQKDSKSIRTKLFEKTLEDDACSIYYKGLFNLLFGKEGKNVIDLKELDTNKKQYIKNMAGFIEIFEKNQQFKDIELKLQCALIYIILNFLSIEKISSLLACKKEIDENNRIKMKILISSMIQNNYIN